MLTPAIESSPPRARAGALPRSPRNARSGAPGRPSLLLNLKQMVGCLIRSEDDRGIVVIVEGRSEKEAARGDGDRRREPSGDTLSRPTRRSS
jgi:hypothetical protein